MICQSGPSVPKGHCSACFTKKIVDFTFAGKDEDVVDVKPAFVGKGWEAFGGSQPQTENKQG